MQKLIEQCFLKDEKDKRKVLGVAYSTLAIVLNLLLFVVKYIFGALYSSIAVISDAFNNLSDGISSILVLAGFRLSLMKPTKKHPHGFGYLEYICALLVSLFVVGIGVYTLFSSIAKMASCEVVKTDFFMVIILVVTIAVKFYLFLSNRVIGDRIDSKALKATSVNSLSDCFSTASILISMAVGAIFNVNLDGVCGAVVSLFILYAGVTSSWDSLKPLAVHTPDDKITDDIWDLISESKNVFGITKLSVYDYGPQKKLAEIEVSAKADQSEKEILRSEIEEMLYQRLHLFSRVTLNESQSENDKTNTSTFE